MLPQPPLWLTLIAFVCALGPLVFFHEFGHYFVARLFKIPAEVFSIGFGRELFGWTDKQG
jgi:regulator of sigma E protease